jgi:hypothetical protein
VTAEDVLKAVYEVANTADWQTNGKYPEQFGPFCGQIVNLIDQHWDGTPQKAMDQLLLRSKNVDAVFRKYAAVTRDNHVVLVVLPGEIVAFQAEMLTVIEMADRGEEWRG